MTTQTQQVTLTREYTAKVLGVAKQQKGDGWVLQTEARPGMEYPDSFYGKDWSLVNPIKPGAAYILQLEMERLRKNSPPDADYKKAPWLFWEKIVAIRPATAQEVTVRAQEPLALTAPSRGEFRTPNQIIRTYALEYATALVVALIAKGADMKSLEVMAVASKYADYIATGHLPLIAPAPEPGAAP